MNSFIHLAKEIGLINQRYYSHLPNATVCKSKEPLVDNDHVVIVKLGDIYGMLVLLALGIGVALITFIAENGELFRRRKPGQSHGRRHFKEAIGLQSTARVPREAWK